MKHGNTHQPTARMCSAYLLLISRHGVLAMQPVMKIPGFKPKDRTDGPLLILVRGQGQQPKSFPLPQQPQSQPCTPAPNLLSILFLTFSERSSERSRDRSCCMGQIFRPIRTQAVSEIRILQFQCVHIFYNDLKSNSKFQVFLEPWLAL